MNLGASFLRSNIEILSLLYDERYLDGGAGKGVLINLIELKGERGNEDVDCS